MDSGSFLFVWGKQLVELVKFRYDHKLTIRLVWVIAVVILVVFFGFIKRLECRDLCYDRFIPDLSIILLLFEFFCNSLLLFCVVENG